MKVYLLPILIFSLLVACKANKSESPLKEVTSNTATKSQDSGPEYTVIPIQQPDGWGYQILQDGKLSIDQKNIPVIQGYRCFDSREKAEKTGNFIVEKIRKGFFPPTLTQEELDSLQVL